MNTNNGNEVTITSEKTTIRAKPRAFAQKMHQILASKSRMMNGQEMGIDNENEEDEAEFIEDDDEGMEE
jgi:hypothetical protein